MKIIEKKKRRLCIFVIYQKNGKLEDYIVYLIKSLQLFVSKFLFVINGKIDSHGIEELKLYGDIIVRENKGYDGGAYKDIFINYIGDDELKKYNQLILMNDTFCGNFVSWDNIFQKMGEEKIDYWGLTKWKEGYSEFLNRNIPEHVQSYFLVFNESLMHSECFKNFWKEMKVPKTCIEAIEFFEIALTQYLLGKGYIYSTWIDKCNANTLLEEGKVIYVSNPDKLITEYSFPVLKKRACIWENLCKLAKIEDSIEDSSFKNIVKSYIRRNLLDLGKIDLSEIEKFYHIHEKIYLYGKGNYSKILCELFHYKNWKIEGIIVTNPQDEQTISLDSLCENENIGIIIATSKKFSEEIDIIIRNKKPHIDTMKICK